LLCNLGPRDSYINILILENLSTQALANAIKDFSIEQDLATLETFLPTAQEVALEFFHHANKRNNQRKCES